jgi:hypothetical protein
MLFGKTAAILGKRPSFGPSRIWPTTTSAAIWTERIECPAREYSLSAIGLRGRAQNALLPDKGVMSTRDTGLQSSFTKPLFRRQRRCINGSHRPRSCLVLGRRVRPSAYMPCGGGNAVTHAGYACAGACFCRAAQNEYSRFWIRLRCSS